MPAASDSPSSGRALVRLVSDAEAPHPHKTTHSVPSFVAQLIANAHGLPQTRERRKAEPADVIAAYRETVERIRALNVKS